MTDIEKGKNGLVHKGCVNLAKRGIEKDIVLRRKSDWSREIGNLENDYVFGI